MSHLDDGDNRHQDHRQHCREKTDPKAWHFAFAESAGRAERGYIPLFFKGVRNNALAEFIQYRAAKNKGWNADNDTVYQYQSYISAIFPGDNSRAGVRRQKTVCDQQTRKHRHTHKHR